MAAKSQAEKSKINIWQGSVSGESCLPGLWADACHLPEYSRDPFGGSGGERGREGEVFVSSYKGTNPIGLGPRTYDLI